MPLNAGTSLGPYEIVSVLGAGGMGEVYRARDTKLNRDVALKILPEAFALDGDRIARFRREAQVLASLNHPNIAAIYGFEDSGSTHALVLELVEGPTLADRIGRGPIPFDEALPIARQIADALEAAHERGVIHRDLKPANIKLTSDDQVKVLDFGLAKLAEPTAGAVTNANVTASPTITSPALMTGVGMLLGTAAYMSPEQAKGRAADKRSDIWAFGCVLYEMLTGTRPFEGDDVSETLASVLKSKPDWDRLPGDTPASIRRVLRRSLERDVRRRLADIHDVRLEIDEALEQPESAPSVDPKPVNRSARFGWIVAVTIAITATGIVALLLARSSRSVPATGPEMRVDIATPPTTDPVSLALSPDGRSVVFVASSDGRSQLWLRSMAVEDSRRLEGTEGARYPFWSPDSRSIGFFADQKLKRLDLDGNAIQTISTAIAGQGGTWNRDIIVFAQSGGSSLSRVSANGGQPTAVTQHSVGPGHRSPQFLPDGEHFLFYAKDEQSEYIGNVHGSPQQRLLRADAAAVYASTGHLLFARQGKLLAQEFDPARLQLSGNPFLVSDQLMVGADSNRAALSTSNTGAIGYRRGSTTATVRQLVWFDRSGKMIAAFADPDPSGGVDPSLSPDERRVALWRNVGGNPDVWVIDSDGRRTRLTSSPSADMFPIWSPDGNRIVFGSNRVGAGMDLYTRNANGGDEQLIIATSPRFASPLDWSVDGRFILYGTGPAGQAQDLWAVAVGGDRKPIPVANTEFTERLGQFSPDGKWVAYQSDESGQFEIYVQRFPVSASKVVISVGGGGQPRWRRDGKELFYVAPDGRLMSASIRIASDGVLATAVPVALFPSNIGAAQPQSRQQYAVADNGQRFLLNTLKEESSTTPITLLLNWNGRKK